MILAWCVFALLSLLGDIVCADCGVVSRKEWDALTPVNVEYLPRPVELVIIEHTATGTCGTNDSCAEIVRSIQTYHMETFNYWDIGYSFLIGGNGKVYEGTGWLHVGAHTYGYNRRAIGIAFIGNYNNCGVVSKEEWGGLNPEQVEYLPRPVDLVTIQHTMTSTCVTNDSCAEIVRTIQLNHMETLNIWDIAYSFFIGGNGKVYEGTGWLHVGAHTYGYNRRAIGIAFIGNYNNAPTIETLDAAKALIQCGVDRGHLKPQYYVVANRRLLATENPGRKLYNVIRRWPDWVQDISSYRNKTLAPSTVH